MFLDPVRLEELRKKLKYRRRKSVKPSPAGIICFGCGAAIPFLRGLFDFVFYVDLTREELFNRSMKKPIFPLGSKGDEPPVHKYPKRFWYVDSQVLNRHKKYVLKRMDWYIDGGPPEELKLVPRNVYEGILSALAQYPFRIKPLYLPGVWGGTWLQKVRNLPEIKDNFSQSWEIVPCESGFRVVIGDACLEMPFFNLLWQTPVEVLGEFANKKFHGNFPLWVNYDNCIGGGNMAIQVHADTAYMKKHFNEPTGQDESYYIADTGPGSKTYLGFKEEADIEEFRQKCIKAEKDGIPFNHDKYVNSIPSKPGDYFLIPAGTIHASGRNQAVLEIDSIFSAHAPAYTFHFYDYMRPDLDGTLRAIHLERAFKVVKTSRRARWVAENLKQKPRLIRSGEDWAEYVIGERKERYYKAHRLEFATKIDDDTKGKFHILTLVEGDSIIVQSQEHPERRYKLNFSETLIVPACLGKYSILNQGSKPCKVVKALISEQGRPL